MSDIKKDVINSGFINKVRSMAVNGDEIKIQSDLQI